MLSRLKLLPVNRHKKAAKPEAAKTATVDVPSETIRSGASTPAMPLEVVQTVEAESAAVVKSSEDKLPGKTTEAPAQFQMNICSHHTAPAADNGDYPSKDQAEIKIQSPWGVDYHLCITDFGQQDHQWLGEVAEVNEPTATEIEIVVRISLQVEECSVTKPLLQGFEQS